MPPVNSARRASSQSIRQKPIVPAIPLSLARPKAKPKAQTEARPKPEPKPEPELVGENGTDSAHHEPPQEVDQISETAVNGHASATAPVEHVASEANAKPDAGTSDVSSAPAAPLSTPPTAHESSEAAGPTSSRQATSGPDLRAIPTELPPAFVPSAERHTPQSTTSSSRSRPPFLTSFGHAVHPSAGSIVFGSMDSQTSSPAPPRSDGSAFTPPPHLAAASHASQPYPTAEHATHVDSHMFRLHHPGILPPAAQWHTRHSHPSSHPPPYFQQQGPTAMHHSTRDSVAGLKQPNGVAIRARTPPASITAISDDVQAYQPVAFSTRDPFSDHVRSDFKDPRASFHASAPFRQHTFHQQLHSTSSLPHPDVLASQENAESLRAHLQTQFGNDALADCQLHISEPGREDELYFNGHLIILSRSETLLSLIEASRQQNPNVSGVRISLSGHCLRIAAFMDALRYLYGGPVLSLEHPRPALSAGEQTAANAARIRLALQHIAVGSWLKLPAFAGRGLEVASSMLRWDTIAEALAFALEGGLSHIWAIEDGSEDKMSSSSSDDSLNRHDLFGIPAHEPYSTTLIQRIIGFAIHMFPLNFYLDTSAPDLASCSRLPSIAPGHESRQSRSDPRLSQIRFGDAPAEELQRPSFATTVISSVLLSLPLALLKCILEHFDLAARLGPDTVGSIMRQVVMEREARRVKALRAHETGHLAGSPNGVVLQNLHWEESVEHSPQHRAGLRLARRRRDIDTPTSSTAASEQMR